MSVETCGRCNRKLKTEKSREKGFGPVCWQKVQADNAEAEMQQLEEKGQTTIDDYEGNDENADN